MDHDGYGERATDDSMRMELRNPSDALQILVRSSDASSNRPSSRHRHQHAHNSTANAPTNVSISRPSSSVDNVVARSHVGKDWNHSRPPTQALDDYDLVQRGLLRPSVLPELLLMLAVRAPEIDSEFG